MSLSFPSQIDSLNPTIQQVVLQCLLADFTQRKNYKRRLLKSCVDDGVAKEVKAYWNSLSLKSKDEILRQLSLNKTAIKRSQLLSKNLNQKQLKNELKKKEFNNDDRHMVCEYITAHPEENARSVYNAFKDVVNKNKLARFLLHMYYGHQKDQNLNRHAQHLCTAATDNVLWEKFTNHINFYLAFHKKDQPKVKPVVKPAQKKAEQKPAAKKKQKNAPAKNKWDDTARIRRLARKWEKEQKQDSNSPAALAERYGILSSAEKQDVAAKLGPNPTYDQVKKTFMDLRALYNETALACELLVIYLKDLKKYSIDLEIKNLIDYANKFKEAKLLTVPWEAIEFGNGHVKFHNFGVRNGKIFLDQYYFPYACSESRESYNHIKLHFVSSLPKIKVFILNFKIVGVATEVNLLEAIRILKELRESGEWDINGESNMFASTLDKAKMADRNKVLNYLRARKSAYFNRLINLQSTEKQPVPCSERMEHTATVNREDAFIFTLRSTTRSTVTLIFENVNEDRATLKFVARADKYEQALRCIFDFMTSDEVNKRQLLQYGHVDFQRHGILYYRCINHTTVYEWAAKI